MRFLRPVRGDRRFDRHPERRPLHADEDGVSTVLGAVLLLGLLFSFFAVVQVDYVPVWEEDAEAEHMRRATQDFSQLDAAFKQQAASGSGASFSQPIAMSPEAQGLNLGGFLGTHHLPSTLRLQPGGQEAVVNTNKLLLQTEGNSRLFALGESWEPFDSGDRAEGVNELLHLRVRILDPAQYATDGGGGGGGGGGGSHVGTLTVMDANGDYAGELVIEVENFPSGYGIRAAVRNADGTIIFDQIVESFFQQHEPDYYWFDVLDDALFFDAVLAAAAKPYDLLFTNLDLDAEYALTFASGEGGGVLEGSGGITFDDFERTVQGGSVEIAANNNQLPERTLRLEHGAVISAQPDGAAFVVEPEFDVRTVGSLLQLRTELVSLTGDGKELSSSSQLIVKATPGTHEVIRGQVPSWTMTLSTPYPDLWVAFWEERLGDAGYSAGEGHFATSSSATSATLSVYGTDTSPTSEVYDIALTFSHRTARFDIQG